MPRKRQGARSGWAAIQGGHFLSPFRRALALSLAALLLTSATVVASHGDPHGRGGRDPAATSTSAATAAEEAEPAGNGTLVVVANATGGDGSFTFDASGPGLPDNFTLATTNGTASATFANLSENATFALAPRVPAGWNLTHAACTQGEPGNLTLPENGTVTCWFDLLRLATLVVVKNATGGDGTFRFETAGDGLPANFTLATTNGTASATFGGLTPGRYGVNESDAPGWNLTRAACSDGAHDDLSLDAGETVTCWFENARLNTIVVRKVTQGGDGTFEFTTSGGSLPERFNLTTVDGSASVTFENVTSDAAHAIREVVPEGWLLASESCDRGEPGNVTLAPGQAATCTFTNVKLGTVVLVAHATGGDATFRFTTDGQGGLPAEAFLATSGGEGNLTFRNVQPGQHHATRHLPDGWRATGAWCTSGAPGNFTLAAGGTVTCTFDATRLAELRGAVHHDRDRDGAREAGEEPLAGWRVWLDANGNGALDAGESNVTTGADGAYVFPAVEPGTHVVRLVVPEGWAAIAPADATRVVHAGSGAIVTGLDFLVAGHVPAPTGAGGGIGFWRNWDKHDKHAEEDVDAWVRAIAASSGWLMPAGYGETADDVTQLVEDATRQCNKRLGKEECARLRFQAHYLAMRLNLMSGRLAAGDAVHLGAGAREWLGLGETATVQQVVDAIEAKAGSGATRQQLLGAMDAIAHANG